MKKFLSVNGDDFVEHTIDMFRGVDNNTILTIVDIISVIDDIRVLSVLENIADIVKENTPSLDVTTSSTGTNNHLQSVISSTVSYVEKYLKSDNCDDVFKSRCKQTLQKAAGVCTNLETLRTITKIVIDTSVVQPSSSRSSTVVSTKDLNLETVKQLTSPTTSYDAIRHFTEHAGTGVYPCVVVEIVLKWWSVQTNTKDDMSFIRPLITTLRNVSSEWYANLLLRVDLVKDERYEGLKGTPDLPDPNTESYTFLRYGFHIYSCDRKYDLLNCIRKGDGTPVRFKGMNCSKNMEKYLRCVPEFRYSDTTVPPYGDAKCCWYIITRYNFKFVSLITDSKEDVLHDIKVAKDVDLGFVPGTELLFLLMGMQNVTGI